ncbi:zinc-binding dehydrogenase [Gordonia insulae]|uniref:alcohol dehydrogenase n=1 Tax=Gordonia insulae TaxID=2420509 RepID=A0A3G8JV71_9ACTN|nr:zinc-binding dehydrogenase [Gordonia insulae]AZG48060.1 L-threonine 3-dehydrogenase [Gordonia insulae]
MDSFAPRLTRAAVWRGDRVDLVDMVMPRPVRDEVVVRIRLATVCGSDLHTVTGRRQSPCPSILGHESVGDVVATGPEASVAVGERVIWSVTVVCGQCARCRQGFTAKCERVRKVGHEPFDGDWPLSGGYAEHILLPSGTTIVTVPDRMPDAVAAPAACSTATVMAALEQAGELRDRRVLVVGAGMLGVTAVAAATERGAHVLIAERDSERRSSAESFGASADDGEPVDAAIDFTGSAQAVRAGYHRLDVGGVLVLAGSVAPGPTLAIDPEQVVRRWLTIRGIHNYEPRHLQQAVDFLDATRHRYPWADLVTEPVALADIATALRPPPVGRLRVAVAGQTADQLGG